MGSIHLALIVFGITLLITKSRLFACKREYVDKRYKASKQNTGTPWWIRWIHRIWHAIWTCPMCSGAWWSLVVCAFWGAHGYIADVIISFAINWLIHCGESFLFWLAKYFEDDEKKSDKSLDRPENDV
jgi:hypothetical protein